MLRLKHWLLAKLTEAKKTGSSSKLPDMKNRPKAGFFVPAIPVIAPSIQVAGQFQS